MLKVINWLLKVEQLACEAYRMAAKNYSNQPAFQKFLLQCAEDEAWHYHVMGSASDYLSSGNEFESAISVDEQTRQKIIQYFVDIKHGSSNPGLSKKKIAEKIIAAEFSEWNDIFLYVVNTLKEHSKEFMYPAASMQAHIKSIAYYFETEEKQSGLIQKVKALPPVWVEKILIVEDDPAVANLVKGILHRDGDIDIVDNGQEALQKIKNKYYKLIVSDIDMPIMDGISLLNQAVRKFPNLGKRFLFLSGGLSMEHKEMLTNKTVAYLEKPAGISAIQKTAYKILLSKTH